MGRYGLACSLVEALRALDEPGARFAIGRFTRDRCEVPQRDCPISELEAHMLGADIALTRIEEALALARQVDNRCDLAFPHLLRGELLRKRDPSNPAPAEEAFLAALAIAQEQGARSWGLRGALELAKLYQSIARPAQAHIVLAPAVAGFSATPEMPEIAEAQDLLVGLA
jgi:hypothetical protein